MSYPIFLNLAERRCVVVGGGAVATRRVEQLIGEVAIVNVVSPEASPALAELATNGRIAWRKANYEPSDLAGAFLAIAATGDKGVNAQVARDADAMGILVCCASDYTLGNFTTPAIIDRGDLKIAVTTGGASPTLTSYVKSTIEKSFGPEWALWAEVFGRLRRQLQKLATERNRQAAARRVLANPIVARFIVDGNVDAAAKEAQQCILSSPA
jgi:precorrin-2 dehydrogenase/sirohydrochlorin ferrochelatase